MNFESLANELLLDLFEYINGVHLLRAFYGLNSRFNDLLFIQLQQYHLDFRSISKPYFKNICQEYLPLIINRVISLHLSSNDETPDLPNVFLSYGFTFNRFNHLQSLSLYYIHSIDFFNQIIDQCLYLKILNMIDCYFTFTEEEIRYFLNKIWSLPKLIHWKDNRPLSSGIWLEEISVISLSIKYISIENMECNFEELSHLFQYTPHLRRLVTSIPHSFKDQQLKTSCSSIISLECLFNSSIPSMKTLLQNMPNLQNLTLNITSFSLNGYEWEKILVDYLPNIKLFQLKMNLVIPNLNIRENEINKLLASFRTEFWIDKHRWFVRCDWNLSNTINHAILYTLPYAFEHFIYSKWTSTDDNDYYSYDCVTDLLVRDGENDHLRFPKLRHLEINLPFNDTLWSIIPKIDRLTSLFIKLSDKNLNYNQLQELFNRASSLYSLTIGIDNWINITCEFFSLTSTSIRQIYFMRKTRSTIQYLNNAELDKLMNSSLACRCNVLALGVENRTKAIDLINTMSNLQSLIVQCEDDALDPYESPSTNDELVEWLRSYLPSTYSITRDIGTSNIRVWINR